MLSTAFRKAILATAAGACLLGALGAGDALASGPPFPHYDHVFVLIDENHGYGQIIGNPVAPEINALAQDYGVATNYTGVGDPSEPNYVGMLGGSTFGIETDNPFYFPGGTVSQPNLMSQVEAAGLSWKGYFQGMPYAGYRGFCFPAKCNGIPDSDTQYVSKHNGIVNFEDMQTPGEFAKLNPIQQLGQDLASNNVPNLSYIVPDECHDMHGAPPWCIDSGAIGSTDDNWLVATGDAFVGQTVNEITSSPVWQQGNDAIVVTFDEGNQAKSRIATIVISNHGPRRIVDRTPYNHYALLASLEQAFGLGCLQESCTATPMRPLFEPQGASETPTLPPPFVPPPDGSNTVSPTGPPHASKAASLTSAEEWQVVPSPDLSTHDNNLAGVSAGSGSDAWAVGDYYPPQNPEVLSNLGEHWDGHRWTGYALPDVGPNENTLLAVSELPDGQTWAAGYYADAEFEQRGLVEHWDGSSWQVIPTPEPGAEGDILYGIAAASENDVWAVGGQRDAAGIWHPLVEHWDGSTWTVVASPDPNGGGSLLYAVTAPSAKSVYVAGQSGTAFPSEALVEQWNGKRWSNVTVPAEPAASLDPFAITATGARVTVVGSTETDRVPFTPFAASGTKSGLSLQSPPASGAGENDLFGVADQGGSIWAVGWEIEPASEEHETLVEREISGAWTLQSAPNPGTGENGLGAVTAVPGGGLWAVGITTNKGGNPATLIEYHPKER